MALDSAKTTLEKRLEKQLQELQDRLSRQVTAFSDNSEAAKERRWDACKDSTEHFGRTYLPHYFTSESATYHADLDQMVSHRERHVFIVHGPRDHAKSTRIRVGLLRRVLNGSLHYPLVVSEELKLSKGHLNYLAAELTANRRIQADFDVEVQRHSIQEGILQLRVTPQATGLSHLVKIEAESYGTGVKGKIYMQYRPDFAVIDDFEDTKSSRNEEIGRQKVEWVFQELYPAITAGNQEAGQPGGPIIWLGNTGRDTSALYLGMLETVENLGGEEGALRRYLERGTLPGGHIPSWPSDAIQGLRNGLETGVSGWDDALPSEEAAEEVQPDVSIYCYRAVRQDEETGETVYLWPERYKASWYHKMRLTMGPSRFESEMNGNPQREGVFFDEEWFPTYDELPEDLRHYLWMDPAFGESDSGSYKAIVVCATDRQRYYVVDAWVRKQEPVSAAIEAMYVLFKRHELLRHGGYENDFGQDDRLKKDLQDAADRHGWPLPVAGDSNMRGSKEARIESMEPLASNMNILWPSAKVEGINRADVQRLKSQMLTWPDGADDGPDALESCIARMRHRGATDPFEYESMGRRRYADRRQAGRRR